MKYIVLSIITVLWSSAWFLLRYMVGRTVPGQVVICLIIFVMVVWGGFGFAFGYILRGLDDGYDPEEL